MVDFKEMIGEKPKNKEPNPLEIFKRLDKSSGKEYLRPNQKAILLQWYEKHSEKKDIVVKMHTGQGKTLVGLLMLQSYMNSGHGPALYLCPNNYLVSQIVEEAKAFGISVVEFTGSGSPPPLEFKNSEAILVATCNKLFNGKSVFGVTGSDREQVKIGSIVMDDAHKCLAIIKDSFSIKINKKIDEGGENQAYKKFLNLFESSLLRQAEGTCSDIKSGSDAYMAIPFWDWTSKKDDALAILQENKKGSKIEFAWNLIRNKLEFCTCIISGKKLEITPRILPIEGIPSFVNAERRIFLSATLTEDAFLVRDLDIASESVNEPLMLEDEKYSGERMVLIPTLLNPRITREDIIKWISKYAQNHGEFGIFALVPSRFYLKEWNERGAKMTNVSDLNNSISDLKELIKNKTARHVTVLLNEYDGVDLPDSTCRILCLDSLPSYTSLSDKYAQDVRSNSHIIQRQLTQRIEQGIGRGIRGPSDWCIVITTGNKLTNFLSEKEKNRFLSNDTKEQIKIAREISDRMKEDKDHNLKVIEKTIDQCINRDEGWREFYHSRMERIEKTRHTETFLNVAKLEREAEFLFQCGRYKDASEKIREIINMNIEDSGWYFQLMATYLYPHSIDESMDKQIKAHEENPGLHKPNRGVTYSKLANSSTAREESILEWVKKHSPNEIILNVSLVLDSITFGIDSETFEKGIEKLGTMLGFPSHRPEKMTGKGPDNLWNISGKYYWTISCKNDVKLDREFISKTEAGQLSNEIAWFSEEYSESTGTHVCIHPSNVLNHDAFLNTTVNMIIPEKLNMLKSNVQQFYDSLAKIPDEGISSDIIRKKLSESQLDLQSLNSVYFVKTAAKRNVS